MAAEGGEGLRRPFGPASTWLGTPWARLGLNRWESRRSKRLTPASRPMTHARILTAALATRGRPALVLAMLATASTLCSCGHPAGMLEGGWVLLTPFGHGMSKGQISFSGHEFHGNYDVAQGSLKPPIHEAISGTFALTGNTLQLMVKQDSRTGAPIENVLPSMDYQVAWSTDHAFADMTGAGRGVKLNFLIYRQGTQPDSLAVSFVGDAATPAVNVVQPDPTPRSGAGTDSPESAVAVQQPPAPVQAPDNASPAPTYRYVNPDTAATPSSDTSAQEDNPPVAGSGDQGSAPTAGPTSPVTPGTTGGDAGSAPPTSS